MDTFKKLVAYIIGVLKDPDPNKRWGILCLLATGFLWTTANLIKSFSPASAFIVLAGGLLFCALGILLLRKSISRREVTPLKGVMAYGEDEGHLLVGLGHVEE